MGKEENSNSIRGKVVTISRVDCIQIKTIILSYEDRKQPYEEPTQPENEAQPPSDSKISENYITAHTEQNQQHIEYEARNAMNNLNLNENANGATYENYSQNEENEVCRFSFR